MKHLKLLIIFFFSNFSFSQTTEISKIENEYNSKIENLKIQFNSDLKKLPKKDYVVHKNNLQRKYDEKISLIISEKNKRISNLKEIEYKSNEQKRKQNEQLQNIQNQKEEEERKYREELAKIENEKKQIEEQKQIEAENEKRRLALEKEKLELEKLKRAEKERIAFEKSDLGKQLKVLEQQFKIWLVKDEFEDDVNYKNRIKNNYHNKFNKLKDSLIISKITISESKPYLANYWDYNINNNILTFKFRYKAFGYTEYETPRYKDSLKINVSIDIAKYLRSKIKYPQNDEYSYFLVFPLEKKLKNNNYEISKLLLFFPKLSDSGEGFLNNENNNDLKYLSLLTKNKNYYISSSSSFFMNQWLDGKDLKLKDCSEFLNGKNLPNENLYLIIDLDFIEQKTNTLPEDLGLKYPLEN